MSEKYHDWDEDPGIRNATATRDAAAGALHAYETRHALKMWETDGSATYKALYSDWIVAAERCHEAFVRWSAAYQQAYASEIRAFLAAEGGSAPVSWVRHHCEPIKRAGLYGELEQGRQIIDGVIAVRAGAGWRLMLTEGAL